MSAKDDGSESGLNKEISSEAIRRGQQNRSNIAEKANTKKRSRSQPESATTRGTQPDKPLNTIEKKRLREQRRRADLGERFSELTSLLREIDPDFRGSVDTSDAEVRGCESAIPASATMDSSSLSRLDIIAHTITTLRRIHNENETRRGIIATYQLSATGGGPRPASHVSTLSTMLGNPGLVQPQPQLSGFSNLISGSSPHGQSNSHLVQALLAEERRNIALALAQTQHQQAATARSASIDSTLQTAWPPTRSAIDLLAFERQLNSNHHLLLQSGVPRLPFLQESSNAQAQLYRLQALARNASLLRTQGRQQQDTDSKDDDTSTS